MLLGKIENYILQHYTDFPTLDDNIMEIVFSHYTHYQQNQFTSTFFIPIDNEHLIVPHNSSYTVIKQSSRCPL